jgi:hypothetical protein
LYSRARVDARSVHPASLSRGGVSRSSGAGRRPAVPRCALVASLAEYRIPLLGPLASNLTPPPGFGGAQARNCRRDRECRLDKICAGGSIKFHRSDTCGSRIDTASKDPTHPSRWSGATLSCPGR